ncbi:T9SS type A sorting domain-containing protein, partial [Calditrichota bacterium]
MKLKSLRILLKGCILIFIVNDVFAQLPDTLWSKIHDVTIDLDEGKCVRQTNDGGFIITGSCVPNGMISAIDLALLKTDATGNILWTKTYDRQFIEEGLAVEQTFDGGYLIGGRALNVTGPNPPSDHDSQVWILKTDSNGDTLWTKTYGRNEHDYCTSIAQTQDSGYVLVGTKNAKMAYPPHCFLDCNDFYSSNTWLLKTNKDGDTLWSKSFIESSYGNCVKQTPDSGFIITGTLVSGNQMDIILIKTNAVGNTSWTKIIGTADSLDFGKFVQPVTDGYIITGHAGPLAGFVDAFLIKTDLQGNVIWKKTYGGFGGDMSDSGNYLEICPDGSIFVTGIKNAQWYIHYGDMWVFKTDAEGSLLWEKVYNVKVNDYSWSGCVTSDNSFVITGMTAGTGIGDGSIWLAKIGQGQSGIRNDGIKNMNYVLSQNFPNPFNSETQIKYTISSPNLVTLKIYDILGQEVYSRIEDIQSAITKTIYLNAENFSSGVYYYKLQVGNDYSETK